MGFGIDRLLRDEVGKPIGRVVFTEAGYSQGSDKIPIAVLSAPKSSFSGILLGLVVYVDGLEYVIPRDVNPIKVVSSDTGYFINSFYLEKVKKDDGQVGEMGQ